MFAHYIIPIDMRIPMRTIITNGYLPLLVDPDFQLDNKMDYLSPGCFMTVPFSNTFIQNDYKFNNSGHVWGSGLENWRFASRYLCTTLLQVLFVIPS